MNVLNTEFKHFRSVVVHYEAQFLCRTLLN